jgi:hypothetical protein
MGSGLFEGNGLSPAVQPDPEGAQLPTLVQRLFKILQVALATGLYLH